MGGGGLSNHTAFTDSPKAGAGAGAALAQSRAGSSVCRDRPACLPLLLAGSWKNVHVSSQICEIDSRNRTCAATAETAATAVVGFGHVRCGPAEQARIGIVVKIPRRLGTDSEPDMSQHLTPSPGPRMPSDSHAGFRVDCAVGPRGPAEVTMLSCWDRLRKAWASSHGVYRETGLTLGRWPSNESCTPYSVPRPAPFMLFTRIAPKLNKLHLLGSGISSLSILCCLN
jgi:hypothetical protein